MRRIRAAWDEFWDRFSASDPGLLRLSNACTVVAAILLTLLVLSLLSMPVTLLVAGALAAMVASFAVSDPRPRDQAITLGFGFCVAVAVTTAGAELYHHRVVSDVLFVALIFIAVYIRRFGPRGTGLGLMGFQLYFVSQFTRVDPHTLPRMCAVLAIAFAAAAVARFGLVRATPERTLDRLRHAFRARLAATVEAMAELAGQPMGSPAGQAAAHRLHRRTARLHQCALLIQVRLGPGLPDPRAASLVERRVAEAEIAADRLRRLLLRALSRTPPDEPNPADPALRASRAGDSEQRSAAGSDGRGDEGQGSGTGNASSSSATGSRLPLSTAALAPAAAVARSRVAGPILLAGRSKPGSEDPAIERLSGELRVLRTLVLRTVPGLQLAGFTQARDRLLGYRDGDGVPRADAAVRDVYLALGELARAVLGLRMAFGYETDPQDTSPHSARSREELEAEERGFDARESAAGEPAEATGLRRITTRLAFQVSAGSALAILGGELLSAQRWYWAVLTCWVVFVNASSTGDILIKGYRRVTGTVAGVLAGGALASVVNGDPRVAFALAIACVFAMFFTAALSHILMSFFVTTMLGLLYTLLGMFSPGVLVLRIEETALGAACGFLAAMFVLPVRADRHTDERLITVLERLRESLTLSLEQIAGGAKADVLHAARDMDAALDALHASMEPLTHPVNPLRLRRQRARYVVRLLDSCAYHARSLAAIAEITGANRGVGVQADITEIGRRLDGNAAALADFLRRSESKGRAGTSGHALAGGAQPALRTEPSVPSVLDRERVPEQGVGSGLGPQRNARNASNASTDVESGAPHSESSDLEPAVVRVLRHLQRIDEALLALARPLGMSTGDEAAHPVSRQVPQPT